MTATAHWTAPGTISKSRYLDAYEFAFVEAKHAAGVPAHHIAKMLGRSLDQVKAAIPKPAPPKPVAVAQEPAPERLVALTKKIAARYGVTVDLLRGRDTKRVATVPRQALMLELSEAGFSTTKIGLFLGGRDHATVMFGLRQHAKRMEIAA